MQNSSLPTYGSCNGASSPVSDCNALPSCTDVIMGNTDEALALHSEQCLIHWAHVCYWSTLTHREGTVNLLWWHLEKPETRARKYSLRVRLFQKAKRKRPGGMANGFSPLRKQVKYESDSKQE